MEFRKVADGCFHEVLSDDTTTPWYRRYHALFMALDDIVAVDGGSVAVMGVNFADEDSQQPLRQISAKARLMDKSTLIIMDDESGQLGEFPSVPMKMRHPLPGNLDLRARKDHHAHAYAHPPEAHRVPPT